MGTNGTIYGKLRTNGLFWVYLGSNLGDFRGKIR